MSKNRGLRRFCMVFIILDIAAAVLLVLLITGSLQGEESRRDTQAEILSEAQGGERSHDMDLAAAEAAKHVTMLSEVKSGGGDIPLFLSNGEDNRCAVMIEISLPETGETIAESGLVDPGWRLERLPTARQLDEGEYFCLVRCMFYTMDGNEFIGKTGKHLLLTVER